MSDIHVLDPTNETVAAESLRCERPETLEGKVLGVIDNGKSNSDVVLQVVSRELRETYHLMDIVYFRKPSSSHQIPYEKAEKMAKECAAVLTGTGD